MPTFVRHFPTSKTNATRIGCPSRNSTLPCTLVWDRGNQYELERTMINWARRMLNIPRTRTEEPLHVFLNEPSIEALELLRKRGGVLSRVFRAKRTDEMLRRRCTWFESALKEANIVGFHWHDLRNTFRIRLRQKGAKLEDIPEALGHKTLLMSER
jgi:integrase